MTAREPRFAVKRRRTRVRAGTSAAARRATEPLLAETTPAGKRADLERDAPRACRHPTCAAPLSHQWDSPQAKNSRSWRGIPSIESVHARALLRPAAAVISSSAVRKLPDEYFSTPTKLLRAPHSTSPAARACRHLRPPGGGGGYRGEEAEEVGREHSQRHLCRGERPRGLKRVLHAHPLGRR